MNDKSSQQNSCCGSESQQNPNPTAGANPADSGCCSTPSISLDSLQQADSSAGCAGAEISLEQATESTSCCDSSRQKTQWQQVRDKLLTAWTLIPLIPLVVWLVDSSNTGHVLSIASQALLGTAPFIVFAVLLIAYLKATGAEVMVARAFEGRENRMIVFAAFFGGLAPFCSCEVIPFIAGLLAVGTPLSAVMAFWLSSPLIDPPSLLITAGALGWDFAIGKAAAAVFLGLFGGFAIKLMTRSGAYRVPLRSGETVGCSSAGCATPQTGQAQWQFWQEQARMVTFRRETRDNALFLFKWLSLAYLLEALLILYVPAELIGGIVGGEGVGPVFLGALVGMPAYLNSFAAPPLVAGLMEQGMSAGSAMAFMTAGAISSIPAMTAVYSLVKKQVFAAYMLFGFSGAVMFGLLFALLR
ncbi:MAG: permease [Gammaproteobacteria bacterium]|nr:permease [Gammaproteobacteria bacterium]